MEVDAEDGRKLNNTLMPPQNIPKDRDTDPKPAKVLKERWIKDFSIRYECECFTNGKPTLVHDSAKECPNCHRANIYWVENKLRGRKH